MITHTFLWCVDRCGRWDGCIGNKLLVYFGRAVCCWFSCEFCGLLNFVSIRRNECHFLIAPRVICPIYNITWPQPPSSSSGNICIVSRRCSIEVVISLCHLFGDPAIHPVWSHHHKPRPLSPHHLAAKQSVASCPFRETDPYVILIQCWWLLVRREEEKKKAATVDSG